MRFNKQELIALASQTSQTFDREGILVIKERQDGFFRRSEGCSARWFRLRGNLLFYLRGTEQLSEPMGVVVLGHHQVKVQDQDENGHWPFQIVWGNGVCYRMATYLESERTMWLKAIETAPYDRLQTEIAALKEKLKKHQPMEDISTWRLHRGVVIDMNEIPLCELALSCDNLLCDAHGQPPSPMIVVLVKYPKGMCIKYSSTETIYKSSNPCFSRTILFRACDGLAGDTVVRIIVYDVKERVSETALPIGYASLLLSTIQEAQRLRIALTSRDKRTVGFVTINGWSLEPSYIGTSPSHTNDRNSVDIPQKVHCHRRSQSLPPRLGLKLKFPSIGSLMKQNFLNSYLVTYRFHSGLGGDITVHEMMAESRLCFHLPLQLLEIYIQREKELLQEILSVGEMGGQWRAKQIELLNTHLNVLKRYLVSKRSLQINISEDKFFKESKTKEEPNLEFAPVNLHLQRLWVHNDTLSRSGFHDIVTVGAFAVHSHKNERSGGLIRLVQQVKDLNHSASYNATAVSKLQAEYDNVAAASRLRDETAAAATALVQLVAEGRTKELSPMLDEIINKTRAMLALWDPAAVEESLSFITWNKAKVTNNNGQKQNENLVKRLNEQISRFESMCSDAELFDSSPSSSKETTPTGEAPPLSASTPNMCPIRDAITNQTDDLNELHFCNDYFKAEKPLRVEGERCSSLRLSKSRTNDNPHFSLDVSRKKYSMDLRSYFKGSSLDQDHKSPAGSGLMELYQRKGSIGEESSLSVEQELGARLRGPAGSHAVITGIEYSLAAVIDYVHSLSKGTLDDGDPALQAVVVRKQLDELSAGAAWLLAQLRRARAEARLRAEPPHYSRACAALQLRRDACFSQALTAAATGLLSWLCSTPHDVIVKLLTSGLGPLCCFEGLLSLYLREKSMWGDMVVAIEDLQTVVFQLTKYNHCSSSIPRVSGSRGALTVDIPVSDSLYSKFQNKDHVSFTVTAVFFNVGINEKATLAEALGEAAAQAHSNADNHARLHLYAHKYRRLLPEDQMSVARASSRTRPLEEVMEHLRTAVLKKTPKNHEVLQLAAQATRHMNGIRFTSCKSAKDRTGMSVTLEQSAVLAAEYHLAETEVDKVLDILRTEGCRRENTHKNIGVRKYAFTKKKIAGLPKEYRPPPGTYGTLQT